MKNGKALEAVFAEAASLYIENEGAALLNEDAALSGDVVIDFAASYALLRRKARRQGALAAMRRVSYFAAPIAACLIIAVILNLPFRGGVKEDGEALNEIPQYNTAAENAAPAPAETAQSYNRAEITLLSAKLPDGYTLDYTDYDEGKTIYHITNETANEIVFVTEPIERAMPDYGAEGFTEITVNGSLAYVCAKRDYNVVVTAYEGALYTLTSPYNTADLLEVAASVL